MSKQQQDPKAQVLFGHPHQREQDLFLYEP